MYLHLNYSVKKQNLWLFLLTKPLWVVNSRHQTAREFCISLVDRIVPLMRILISTIFFKSQITVTMRFGGHKPSKVLLLTLWLRLKYSTKLTYITLEQKFVANNSLMDVWIDKHYQPKILYAQHQSDDFQFLLSKACHNQFPFPNHWLFYIGIWQNWIHWL